ncbi:hypothetical protein [Frankia sp. Cas4]|uniref:hypothetical protein n=1 Tax=Frankia sp. Cas4 TaxID=3073927 RepID=UPI002AD4DCA2|nr:hypothetical protein [Frankia sp. Cas4]
MSTSRRALGVEDLLGVDAVGVAVFGDRCAEGRKPASSALKNEEYASTKHVPRSWDH